MKNKNGFFSMSLIYSFFLVFALISAILLSNYAHNRLLAREFNEEIKQELEKRGNADFTTLENLLINSSFETLIAPPDPTWELSNALAVNNQHYDGIMSVMLNNSSSNTVYISQKLKSGVIKKNHKYYFQKLMFTAGEEINYSSSQIGIKNGSNTKIFYFEDSINSMYKTSNWNTIGSIIEIDDSINEDDEWSLFIRFNAKDEIPFYLDALSLIDFSKSYGYGNEPDVNYLESNVPYFDSKYIIRN